ncbi:MULTISPECIES: phage protein NinX family protein [Citrobacter]|uniref:phage protein NinX family protein n=1 Tax=Citrobacter TaxID=544 RepID=UPI000E3EA7FB|nr:MULTISPECIES: phage protein NinX family protein [Citrobacter]MBD0827687.1 DUF2591 family protein [Citrobacter sp. C1]RFU89293.1 DUF2591 domain-containing protein [Citrobacter gillenii]
MDYSKLSDQEINKLVAFALGCKEVVPDIFMDDVRRYEFDKPKNKSGNKFYFDPCNNPADAWPIISKHQISMCAYERANSGMKRESWWEADVFADFITRDDNPLRAAMIAFLKMQESANVPANSTGSDIR